MGVLTPVLFSVSCLCSEPPSPGQTLSSLSRVKSIHSWHWTCIRYSRQVICQAELSTSSPDRGTTSLNIWQNIRMLTPCGTLVQLRVPSTFYLYFSPRKDNL